MEARIDACLGQVDSSPDELEAYRRKSSCPLFAIFIVINLRETSKDESLFFIISSSIYSSSLPDNIDRSIARLLHLVKSSLLVSSRPEAAHQISSAVVDKFSHKDSSSCISARSSLSKCPKQCLWARRWRRGRDGDAKEEGNEVEDTDQKPEGAEAEEASPGETGAADTEGGDDKADAAADPVEGDGETDTKDEAPKEKAKEENEEAKPVKAAAKPKVQKKSIDTHSAAVPSHTDKGKKGKTLMVKRRVVDLKTPKRK
uniref:Uncharacterized protein n=1 Tax=Ditylenchus dipsaci TaxID=166011 RepID=A0A915EX37_9BILA